MKGFAGVVVGREDHDGGGETDNKAIIAEMVLVKDAYGDLFTLVRRQEPMSLAGEITWNLMPPLTFGTERVVISCVLAPAYDVGARRRACRRRPVPLAVSPLQRPGP